jgi:GT2 family glycosyltransferase
VPAALASLDALVVPSVWPETSPLVIREAFLAGRPVIASDIGGIPELVDHAQNGLLFAPGDIDGLARALRRLADEPGLLDRLKTGAAATAVRSLDEDVTATRRLYESLAPSRIKPVPATTTSPNRLAAIVLNYQTPADTAIAVASLMASDRAIDHLIVVDNDQGPECRDALARWGDRVTYVRTGANRGFAGGMNVGIRRALDEHAGLILLVNSDMVVPPDCVARLEAAVTSGNGTAIVGPLVLSRSVPDVVGSAGIDYNLDTGRMRHRLTRQVEQDVDAVSGCLMLIRRDVFDRIGLLDERYFFSFEEIDFCLRARAAGFATRVAGSAVAYHEGGQAIGPRSPRRLYFAARNHLMLARNHANGDGSLTRGRRSFFIAALNLAHAVKAPGGSLGARLGATLRGIRDYFVD